MFTKPKNSSNAVTALMPANKNISAYDIFTEINDREFMKNFMECLFTPAERDDFANRWILVKEIDKGVTQRDIAKKYNMSLCKITRGSKELNKKDSAFRTVLENYKEKNK